MFTANDSDVVSLHIFHVELRNANEVRVSIVSSSLKENRRWLAHLDIAPPIRPRDACAFCEVQLLSREGRIETILLGDIPAVAMECNTRESVHSPGLSHL